MESINKLLLRQIKKHFGSIENIPESYQEFLADISDSYNNREAEARLYQNALDISSQELRDAFLKQKQDTEIQKETIKKVKEAIYALNPLGQDIEHESGENDTTFLFNSLIQLIAEHKRMELSLKESEFYLREILDSQEVGVIIIDSESHQILFVNKKGANLYGGTKEEIIGKLCHGIICPTLINDCKLHDSSFPVSATEKILVTLNGEHIPILKSVVHTTFNKRKCYVESFVDIRDWKKAEEELINAKDIAEEANKAKSEFLANMSHEIRTPLNGVIGFSDLLMKTNLSENQMHYMQTVYYSANSLLDLINDILDFSKIESGKFELNDEKTDLIELSEQIIDIIKYKVHEKGLELLLNIPADIPRFIEVDPVRLRQVLVNLLGNALKFTDRGEVEFKILLKSYDLVSGEAELEFSVKDTGIGIAKDKQQKIFESFSQADSTTTRQYGGTGLGLTISGKLVEMMGGQLQLESELGIGSRFFYTIKVKAEHGLPGKSKSIENIHKALVVDNNKTNRTILQQMLFSQNIDVDFATCAEGAIRKLESETVYDVLIIDFDMPGMNGFDLIRSIREKGELALVKKPIILLHNSPDDELINAEGHKLGVKFSMIKPVKMTQLFNALSRINSEEPTKSAIDNQRASDDADDLLLHAKFKILVAEDNKTNMKLAQAILHQLMPGFKFIKAHDGNEALALYKEYNPDLIFMDISMPEMNGYDCAREIRQVEMSTGKHVPIIALTAGTVKGEEVRCKDAGMDDYVSKPVVADTIRNILSVWLLGLTPNLSGKPDKFNTRHFDKAELLKRLNGDEELCNELITLSFETYPDLFNDLKVAFENEQSMDVRLIAHSIKGSALSICYNQLADQASKLELLPITERNTASELLSQMENEYKLLKRLLISAP
ncbi:MAG: response regulator [Prolixibacteraceae bacterium]|nr:response regulator [Prolixibacteraceae bacterium]